MNVPSSSAPAASPRSTAGQPLPDPYQVSVPGEVDSPQVARIKQRFKDRYKTATYRRWTFECRWLLNILWALGSQWTRIDARGQKVTNMKLPLGFPRAVTNKFAKVNDDLLNAIISGDIQFNYMPGTDEPKDLGIAEISDRLHEVINDETQAKARKRLAGFWFTYTGNVFCFPYYDYSPEFGTTVVPVYNCGACAQQGQQTQTLNATSPCPTCKTPPTVMPAPQPPAPQIPGLPPPPPPPPPQPIQNFTPAIDPMTGQPQIQDLPIGSLCFDIASPFEVYQDNTIPSGSDAQRWYMRFKRTDIDKTKMDYPQFAEHITDAMPEAFPLSRNYLLAIAYAGSISSDYGYGDSTSKESNRRQINRWELNELPTPEFPQGLRALQIGDYIVEAGPLKTVWSAGAKKGQPWLPKVQFSMSDVGSAWGKPRADYLIPLQFRRNIIESNLQLTAQRTGTPKLLTPEGCKVKNVVGEAGQLLAYNPISLAGGGSLKPEYLEAALGNVQPFSAMIKQIDEDMESIAGTFFITGGESPSGVTAASALCVDELTQALTRDGWKSHNQISTDDEIYTCDENGKGEWQPIQNIGRYPNYEGDVIEAAHKNISFKVTPNHAWYVGNHETKATGLTRVRTDELKQSHHIPTHIPSKENGIDLPDHWIELLGWIAAEGTLTFRGNKIHVVEITQSYGVNGEKCKEIGRLLAACGIPIRRYDRTKKLAYRWRIYGDTARKIAALMPGKIFENDFISRLSARQANKLLDAMMLGDGHSAKNGHKEYYSSNQKLIEQFQMIAIVAGWQASVSIKYEAHGNRKKAYRCSLKHSSNIYCHSLIQKHMKRIPFKGLVWCPQTKNGNWIARRDGKVYLTGNSYLGEKAHQAVAPVKERWAEGWAQCYQYAIELARTNWVDERILSVVGKNKQWEFQKFKQADLAGSVSVKVDYNALFPKSQATERATLLQLYQMGVLAPGDPDTDFRVLEAFGETRLKSTVNGAFEQAQREWDAFTTTGKAPVLKPLVQNSALHLIQHKEDAQSEEYEALPPETQSLWDAHIQAHMMDLMAQQGLAAGGGAPPPPGHTSPAGNTQPGSQAGSQAGPAQGNLGQEPASIQKGTAAADADSALPKIHRQIGS